MLTFPFPGRVRAVIGGYAVQLDDESAFQGYLHVGFEEGGLIEMDVVPAPSSSKAKMFGYLYHGVYLPLSRHMKIPVEELDGRMKALFLVINKDTEHEYIRDKKYLNTKALIEYVDAVKAYGVALDCDIDMFGKTA